MPTLYHVTIATTEVGLATPMLKLPTHAKRLPPDSVITASRKKRLNGLPAWELYWESVTIAEFRDIIDRCGGITATSIAGWVRIVDWKSRATSQETWSDHSCFLDQPEEGDWPIFGTRHRIRVIAREVLAVTNLAL
jgi:hypothetical protein